MQTAPTEWREIGNFIRGCRERAEPLSPVSPHGRNRQSAHLTQTELAELANVSTVLVSKLEQGQCENINPGILKRIAGALKLTNDDEQFMTGLLIPAPGDIHIDEAVPEWIQTGISGFNHPTAIVNPSFDILAWNSKLLGFMGDVSAVPPEQRNVVKSMFCNPAMRDMIHEWYDSAAVMVSSLKMIYALIPPFRCRIREMADSVAAQDPVFAQLWKDAPPKMSTRVTKKMIHPVLGELDTIEMVTQTIGQPFLFRVEFMPANTTCRRKMVRL